MSTSTATHPTPYRKASTAKRQQHQQQASLFFQFSLLIIPWVSRPRPAEKHSTIVTGSEHFKCISVVGGGTCFLHFYPGGSQPLSEINLNIRGLESTTSCLFHSLFLEFVLCRHNASRRPNKRQNILIYVLFYTFFFQNKKNKMHYFGSLSGLWWTFVTLDEYSISQLP